jgi:hypothetical protein
MLGAISLYYRDSHQMSDAEVTDFFADGAVDAGGTDPNRFSIDLDQVAPTRGEPN